MRDQIDGSAALTCSGQRARSALPRRSGEAGLWSSSVLLRDDASVIPVGVAEGLLESVAAEVQPARVEFAFIQGLGVSKWPMSAGRALFHIGSITKTFTALLLAEMAQSRQVSLNDSIGKYLAEAVGCADVRLIELATHTSALPHLPAPLPFARRDVPARSLLSGHAR